ncbi:unnamed protein product [Rotaria socialis]|uniref:Protein kinase domain-containing protein n=1 Tax=Rotaria socialis TaxID=392032 RepID=A0A821NCN6_9BILA|nr:unnamed protein product [Rotaria socialis]
MEKYRILGKKGEGTFSEVLKCQNVRDGTFWAAKKMKQLYKSMDEIHQIREIRVLKQLNGHPNIIFLREIIFDKRTGVLCLIFELMNMNLYEYIRGRQRILPSETVCKFMYQLLKALEYIHRHSFFHRDVKPENILIKDDILKLADFGSCRQTLSKQPYTEYISTRWYRAPECLLTDGFYRQEMDVWSAGCVMFEIITLRPLFPGSNELDQISKIHDILGTPSSITLDKFQQSQENGQSQERGTNQWENGTRIVKTSEDQYQRSDSSSSRSSVNQENESPSLYSHNPSNTYQHGTVNPDTNRLIHSQVKAKSLIDARIQGQSIKKPSTQYPNNANAKTNNFSSFNQSQNFYSSLSTIGSNVFQYQARKYRQPTKPSLKPFLPPVSGASAFSNYPTNNGHASSMLNKDHNQGKHVLGYYPIMSYRSYKK